MKSIEQKLKEDAKAFSQTPHDSIHNIIMQRCNVETIATIKPENSFSKWLVPTVFALFALIFVTLNFPQLKMSNEFESKITPNSDNQQYHVSKEINVDQIAFSFEAKLTQSIKNEQQAIVDDIKYLKELLIL